MGSLLCCFKAPDVEENVDPVGSNLGNCISSNSFCKNLMSKCEEIFRKGETQALPSPVQGATSSNTAVAPNNNRLSDSSRSHGRQLPSNTNSQNAQSRQDGLVTRKGKGTGHSQLQLEPPRKISVQINPKKLLTGGDKQNGSNCRSESSVKVSPYSLWEDEDVCPTCLEEYTEENPKIITECSHHYHLSCIYEWMERSQTCPVCGRLMVFGETA